MTKDLVQQHEAARPQKRTTFGLNLKWLTASRTEVAPDFKNRYDLARRATTAVSQLTGTVANPGDYVQDTLELEFTRVSVHIGFETPNQSVSGIFADEVVEDVGRVFVGLFGSVTNLRGWKRREKYRTNRHPSDAAGLYEILDASLEPLDSLVRRDRLLDDRELDEWACFDAAYGIVYRHEKTLRPNGRFEFLAAVHLFTTDITLDKDRYDVALLGAPLWVRTPPPRPL
jgi:hypothetical protein